MVGEGAWMPGARGRGSEGLVGRGNERRGSNMGVRGKMQGTREKGANGATRAGQRRRQRGTEQGAMRAWAHAMNHALMNLCEPEGIKAESMSA